MLARLSIAGRIYLLVALTGIGLAAVGFASWVSQRDAMFADREREIRSVVEGSVAVAIALQAQVEAGALSPEEARAQWKAPAEGFRFRGTEWTPRSTA